MKAPHSQKKYVSFLSQPSKATPSAVFKPESLLAGFCLLALTLTPATLLAQTTRTWDGGGTDNNWGTADNWDTLPANGNNLVFSGATRTNNTNNLLTSIGTLTFDSGASGFTLGGNALTMGQINSNNASATNVINFNFSRTNSNIVVVSGSTLEINGLISGTGGITRGAFGPGTLRLTNDSNSFTGAINLTVAGVTEFTSVANAGSNSALGAASGASSIIGLGTSTNNPTLRYIGSSNSSTDRVINLGGTTGNRTLDASGSGSVKFLGGSTASGTGNKTFVLTGTSTADNEIGAIANASITDLVSLSKTGDGTWILMGANTFTGTTSISGGVLQLGNGGTTGSLSSSSAITNNGIFRFNRSNTITQGVDFSTSGISGSGALQQNGSGTVVLNANNTYTGATTINSGTLQISGTGNINSTSGITVTNTGSKFDYSSSTGLSRNVSLSSGGGFFHNGSTNYSGTLTWTNGTLGGTNWNGNLNNLTVDANRIISPGNSPGTASTGNQTWGANGSYVWEVNDATGTAGADPGWDLVSGTGTLTISATSSDKFTIYVTSLTLGNISGDASNFDASSNYQWLIADFANPVSGFSSDLFAIDLTNFTNLTSPGSSFAVVLGNDPSIIGGDNSQLYLTYTIPEPSAVSFLVGIGLATLLLRRRSR